MDDFSNQQTGESRENRTGCNCFCGGVGPDVTQKVKERSEAAREHFRKASVEFLKAVRSLIDDRIDQMNRGSQKGTTIPVD